MSDTAMQDNHDGTVDANAGASAGSSSQSELSYMKAVDRINALISDIKRSDTDIDKLADKVSEIRSLIRYCLRKLTAIESQVNEVGNGRMDNVTEQQNHLRTDSEY